MRWQWQNGSEIFSALRAVDTATLPDHRGKGVFKKLTLKAVEIAKTNGDNFIFNTPNSQSRPGYLKMGWEQVGKVGVELLPINPFGAKGAKIQQSRIIDISQINTLLKLHNKKSTQDGRLFTPKSLNFIKWRYLNNPLQDYIIHFDEEFFCALYIKKHKYFNELRISEGLYINNSGFKKINRYARKVARILGAHVVSVAKNDRNFSFYSYRGGLGPILTIRELDISRENLKLVFDFNNWRNSLGDLELF